MATISNSSASSTPLLVLNSDRRREDRNVILSPIDSPRPYVSLAEAATATRELEALYASEALALEGLEIVTAGLPIVVSTDTGSYTAVLDGDASVDRASENRARWILRARVREL